MPDTEADRIIREQRRQREAQERKASIEAAREERAAEERAIDELRTEIPEVLRLLASLNYPDTQELANVEDVPWFMFWHKRNLPSYQRYRIRYKAGWKIYEWEHPYMDTVKQHTLYLLSDGSFHSSWPLLYRSKNPCTWSLHDFLGDVSNHNLAHYALYGLRELRSKLEKMKRQ